MEFPEVQKGSRFLSGVVAVGATYFYFLLFAQFGFLHLLMAAGGGAADVQRAMVVMGLCGLAASLGTGALLGRVAPRSLLRWGFTGSWVVALGSLAATTPGALTVAGGFVGAFTGLVTVALAAQLKELLPVRHLGLGVGAGTGLAYFLANVPPLFEGSGGAQALAAAVAALVGWVAILGPGYGSHSEAVSAPGIDRQDVRGWGFVSILLSFLALVWLDSAAFAAIQETSALRGQTWAGEGKLWGLGITHLLAAVGAGWWIDRGVFRGLLLITYGLFAAAFTALEGSGFSGGPGPIYAMGISFYSVALVVYPAAGPAQQGSMPRRWRSALLFGVAGWLGSALGVGMGQDLHRIPRPFLLAAGLLLVVSWGLRRRQLLIRLLGLQKAALGVALVAVLMLRFAPEALPAEPSLRGRQVYLAEGCIHCHSQYVRPQTADAALWGPPQALDRRQEPPLPGNRRQGPDLSNIGLRRSGVWQRLHLQDPRALIPGSRMPSYDHLFAPRKGGAGSPGEDLVAYLSSLGAGHEDEAWELIQSYDFGPVLGRGEETRGRASFGRYCASCHGDSGRGDGPLAEALFRPAMNLRKGAFWAVSWGPGADSLEEGLARVIKFGLPGTSMPGHETLKDQEVADLVAFVLSLSRGRALGEMPQ